MIKCGVCSTVSNQDNLVVAMFGTAKQGFTKYYRCTAHQHVPPTPEELKQVLVPRLTITINQPEVKCHV